ncbi:MAG: PhoH family protein [Gleimia sp.]|jgi:phosphate starvation-inducible PhoH-like protein|nr:PhoH family protein [Acidobacteriota bacterium]
MANNDSPTTETIQLHIPEHLDPVSVLGPEDEVIRTLEKSFPGIRVSSLGREITISGDPEEVALTADLGRELIGLARSGQYLNAETVQHAIGLLADTGTSIASNETILTVHGRDIRAKTPGQQRYVDLIANNTVVFGIGPAGTGKTYLAMAMAVNALLSGEVRRIVLTRPAVEAGESLGFLPGTLTEKIDPYLRPLYDALNEMIDQEALPRLLAAGTIEVAPLAYMRGRTLNDSFIILDEAQNTTPSQMKMFLTRLGFRSKVVVTGDASQVDLPRNTASGLRTAHQILEGIEDIEFCHLTSKDVVRHRLVGDIIDAYQRWDEEHSAPDKTARRNR